MALKSKKKKTTYQLDLSGVESGRSVVPEGHYLGEVKEVSVEEGQAGDYFKWTFKVVEGNAKGSTLYTNTSTSPAALWRLRGLLEALGVEIPEEAFDLELDELVGMQCMLDVVHEDYEGKPQSKIADYWPAEEGGEEEKSAKKADAKASKKEESAEEEKPAKPTRAEKRRAAKAAEEPEEEEEKPANKTTSKKKVALTQEAITDMDQEELEALIEKHELEVDLSNFKTLKKMQNAVIDAATEAELIGE